MVSRWAVKIYFKIKQERPELSDYDIIDLVLWIRFNSMQPNQQQYAASIKARPTIHNIRDAVYFILDQEVGYFNNTLENILIMGEVITEQLQKGGVPQHMISGKIVDAPSTPVAPVHHTLNCPYCNASLRIPQIYKKTEFECSSCRRAFNVNP